MGLENFGTLNKNVRYEGYRFFKKEMGWYEDDARQRDDPCSKIRQWWQEPLWLIVAEQIEQGPSTRERSCSR